MYFLDKIEMTLGATHQQEPAASQRGWHQKYVHATSEAARFIKIKKSTRSRETKLKSREIRKNDKQGFEQYF